MTVAQTSPQRLLVTGAAGQIGSELVPALRGRYGRDNVVAGVYRGQPPSVLLEGPVERIDVMDLQGIALAVEKHRIDTVVHLAAILSAAGEEDPMQTWRVNTDGMLNVLEVAREARLRRVLFPSSIAVFGEGAPKDRTPQQTVLRPVTMYGVTKVVCEQLGNYYVHRFGLDVRGLRLPGIISSEAPPGGGTTDYAVAIFYEAVRGRPYTAFLKPDTMLPMMYMPDCIRAMIELLEADFSRLSHHCDFNVAGFSTSPRMLAAAIRRHYPEFEVRYEPDFRQDIADSWPNSLDDSVAREEWGWQHAYDLKATVKVMIERLSRRFELESPTDLGSDVPWQPKEET